MAEVELLAIRHAESTAQLRPDLIGGRSNHADLTSAGITQAVRLGDWLERANVLNDDCMAIETWASPALRTLQTGTIALRAAGCQRELARHNGLQELSQGPAEGQPRAEVMTERVLADIKRLQLEFKLPGGESLRDVGLRGVRTMDDIVAKTRSEQQRRIIVFGHGYWIRSVAGLLEKWSHAEIREKEVDNTSVTTFVRSKRGGWELKAFAETPQGVPKSAA